MKFYGWWYFRLRGVPRLVSIASTLSLQQTYTLRFQIRSWPKCLCRRFHSSSQIPVDAACTPRKACASSSTPENLCMILQKTEIQPIPINNYRNAFLRCPFACENDTLVKSNRFENKTTCTARIMMNTPPHLVFTKYSIKKSSQQWLSSRTLLISRKFYNQASAIPNTPILRWRSDAAQRKRTPDGV